MTDDHPSVSPLTSSVLPTNNWTEQKIKKLNEWSHISKIYSTCHSKAQEYYHRQFNNITVAVIMFGALAAVLEGANLLLATPSIGLGITVVLLTSSVSGLNLWLNSKNPAETASAHESMSKGYNRIILKIESELANDDKERENGVKFLTEIRDNLTDLSTGGKSIPLSIWYQVNNVNVNNKDAAQVTRTAQVTRSRTARSTAQTQQQTQQTDLTENNTNATNKEEINVKQDDAATDIETSVDLDADALKVADLLEKYQTARYRSAY